jgi:putative ABC transport system permease protein
VNPLHRKLLREMRRHSGQFAAIILMTMLGTALFGGSFDAWRNLQASYNHVFDELSLADFTIVGVGGDQRPAVAALPGVATVDERDVADTGLDVGGRLLGGRLVSYPIGQSPALDRIRLDDGALPTGPDQVVVEKHLASAMALGPGSTLRVALAGGWQQVTVSGVGVSGEYLWPAPSRQEILVPPDEWGVVFAAPGLVDQAPAVSHQLLVGYAAGADRAALDGQLAQLATSLGATDAYSRAELASNAALQEDMDGFGEMSYMFPMLFLGAAGLAVYVLLGRLVRAQRAEIGVLLALGLRRRTIVGHYVGFGLLAAIIGAIPGALLGVGLGDVVTTLYTAELGIPTRVVNFYPETPIIGIAFGVLMGLLAPLAPAIRAARMSPGEAMRATSASVGQISLAERLLPPLRRLPERWKLIVRGIGRNRLRSGATVLGVVLAITLVLVSWGLLDTTQVLLDQQYVQIEHQSLEVTTFEPVSSALLDQISAMDGVTMAEPVARITVGLSTATGSYGTQLVGFVPDTTMHSFLAPGGSIVPLPASGLLLADALRSRLGLAVGDNVSIIGSDGSVATAVVAGFIHEPLGAYAYGALPYLRQVMGQQWVDSQTRSVMIRTDGAAPQAVRDSISKLPGIAAIVRSDSIKALLDQYMGLFYVFVGVMFVLGALLAFVLIYATISANVAERSVELANLRASGMSAGQIGRMITAENMLLAAIGIVPGLIVGYLVSAEFMASFSSDLFAFDLVVRPVSFVAAALAALVAVGLSLAPTLRAVAAVDLGQVVRERAT